MTIVVEEVVVMMVIMKVRDSNDMTMMVKEMVMVTIKIVG